MRFRSIIVPVFATAGILGINAEPAVAQCDTIGRGDPSLIYIIATSSSIDVSWLLQCPLQPSRVELREGGTSQSQWQDGLLLGTTTPLGLFQRDGHVLASNLAADTLLSDLRLCSIFTSPDMESWCSNAFAAKTDPAPSSGLPDPPRNITVTFLNWHTAHVDWVNGANADYIQFTRTPPVPIAESWAPLDPAWRWGITDGGIARGWTYLYSICGVNKLGQSCGQVIATPPAPPPAPPPVILRVPTNVQATWNGPKEIELTWVPAQNATTDYMNVYHAVAIGLSDVPPPQWTLIGSHLNVNSTSFKDARPHDPPLRHIYNVCVVDGGHPSDVVCAPRAAAPP
jgi:hypothetical protein